MTPERACTRLRLRMAMIEPNVSLITPLNCERTLALLAVKAHGESNGAGYMIAVSKQRNNTRLS